MSATDTRVILFMGKGGVGKTTIAAGSALLAAEAGSGWRSPPPTRHTRWATRWPKHRFVTDADHAGVSCPAAQWA